MINQPIPYIPTQKISWCYYEIKNQINPTETYDTSYWHGVMQPEHFTKLITDTANCTTTFDDCDCILIAGEKYALFFVKTYDRKEESAYSGAVIDPSNKIMQEYSIIHQDYLLRGRHIPYTLKEKYPWCLEHNTVIYDRFRNEIPGSMLFCVIE